MASTTTTHRKGMDESASPGLMTPEQVAEFLGCGRTYIYQLLRTGQIPSLKLGKLRRVRYPDLARYLDALAEDQHPQK